MMESITMPVKRFVTWAAAAVGIVSAVVASVPSNVEPVDDPCSLAVVFFCRMLPMAPDLEGDVDLTHPLPGTDPAAPPTESLPPAPIR